MSILTTVEYSNLKEWVRNEMKSWTYVELTPKQREAFKMLIVEWYGWPNFTLNFSKDMKRIIKTEL